MPIKIDSEFKNIIPPLTFDERKGLEENIKKNGCLDPIKVWNDTIIDGHNRYEICEKHGIGFQTIELQFEDRDAAKLWIIRQQLDRRNISDYIKGRLALQLKEILITRAKEKEALRKTISQTKPIDTNKLNKVDRAILEVLSKYQKKTYAKPDNLYFIQDGDKVKIGCSGDIGGRLKDVTKHLPNAKLIGYCKGDISLEKSLHKVLSEYKINNEWFKLNTTTVSIIKAFVQNADFLNIEKVNSENDVVKKFAISAGTLAKVKKIEEKATPEQKKALETGDKSINKVFLEIKETEPKPPVDTIEQIATDEQKRGMVKGKTSLDKIFQEIFKDEPEPPAQETTEPDTNEEPGNIAGVSQETRSKVETIEEKATDEQKQDLIEGKTSLDKIFQEIFKDEPEPPAQETTEPDTDYCAYVPFTPSKSQITKCPCGCGYGYCEINEVWYTPTQINELKEV